MLKKVGFAHSKSAVDAPSREKILNVEIFPVCDLIRRITARKYDLGTKVDIFC